MTPDEARARFVVARVAHLATVGAGGSPHLVPITFALEADRIYTAVDGKPKRGTTLTRIANIRANPRVAVLIDRYDEDWSALWWARADGSANVVSVGATAEHGIALLRARYPQYRQTEIGGPVICIRVERWSGWAAS